MQKINYFRTIISAQDAPMLKFKHFKTTFTTEDAPQCKKSNIPGPQSVQKTPMLKCKHFKTNSSRTFEYIIVHGHNSFWTNTRARTHEYINSSRTQQLQDKSTRARTYEYICIIFTLLHSLHPAMQYYTDVTQKQPQKLS